METTFWMQELGDGESKLVEVSLRFGRGITGDVALTAVHFHSGPLALIIGIPSRKRRDV